MYYRCLSSSACATLLPSKDTMINANYKYIYANPYYPDSVKQQLGDLLEYIHGLDPEDVRAYKYYHEYAALTTTKVNTPSLNDGMMYVLLN